MIVATAMLGLVAFGPPPLSASIDGRPMPIKTVMGVERGPGDWEITVATEPLRCRDLRRGLVNLSRGGTALRFGARQLLRPDGKLAWTLSSLWFDGQMSTWPKGAVQVWAWPASAQQAKTRSALFLSAETVSAKGRSLVITGMGGLVRCGAPVRPEIAALKHPPTAWVTLAGRKMAIRGATLRTHAGKTRLTLSTGAQDCRRSEPSEINLTLSLDAAGLVTRLYMDGTRLKRFVSERKWAGDRFSARAEGGLRLLDGLATVGGYRLSLAGQLAPRVCSAPGAR